MLNILIDLCFDTIRSFFQKNFKKNFFDRRNLIKFQKFNCNKKFSAVYINAKTLYMYHVFVSTDLSPHLQRRVSELPILYCKQRRMEKFLLFTLQRKKTKYLRFMTTLIQKFLHQKILELLYF